MEFSRKNGGIELLYRDIVVLLQVRTEDFGAQKFCVFESFLSSEKIVFRSSLHRSACDGIVVLDSAKLVQDFSLLINNE